MNCEEIRELVPVYALGSASEEEVLIVEEHIATCREHDAEIQEARETAGVLADAFPPMDPPADLKARIMAQALGQEPVSTGVVEKATQGSGWLQWLRLASLRAHPLAAVFVLVIGGLLVWNVMLQTADQPEKFTHYYWGNDSDWMRVETVLGKSGADVSLGGIDRLDDAHLYHLWVTRGDDTLFVGVFNVSPEGRWAGKFDFTFTEDDRLWITVEEVGSSGGPTGEAVLRTRF